MPQIEHVVVLMLENHSYDNFLGMLGRGPGERPRSDGFTLRSDGAPTASNPYANAQVQPAFRMPTTCQVDAHPSQEWKQSHVQYDNGRNDGFVISDSGAVVMGYWTRQDLPFTYDLATQFPIGDRWFCSVLGQTDPNRRFLIAATSAGMTDDVGTSPGNFVPDAGPPEPANGTIFDRLTAAGISWADYVASFSEGATMELCPTDDTGLPRPTGSQSPSSSPTRRSEGCRASACSTPTTTHSRRRILKTSSSAKPSSPRSSRPSARLRRGAARC